LYAGTMMLTSEIAEGAASRHVVDSRGLRDCHAPDPNGNEHSQSEHPIQSKQFSQDDAGARRRMPRLD